MFNFSTSVPADARKRLIRAASGKEFSENFLDNMEKYVKEGYIRVGDPIMYNEDAPIFPTEKCTTEIGNKIKEICENCYK